MVLDLIILAIVLALVVLGAVRGIAKTLLNVLCVAASSICSYLGAGLLSNLIYTSVISPKITSSVTDSMADSTASAATIIQEAIDGLPDFVVGIFNTFGITLDSLSKSANGAVGGVGANASQAVDFALKPVITSVLSVIFVIVLFIVFIFIFKIIARKVERLFHIPIVGTLNRILGGALGLAEAVFICVLGITVLKVMFFFSQEPFISEQLISQSVIFSAIYNSEALESVTGFLGVGNNLAQTASEVLDSKASEAQSLIE